MKAIQDAQVIRLSSLAWAAALLPLVTIHLSFFASVVQGVFPLCNPYWIDCTSVSHGGRHGSAYFIFKAGMMPTAVLLGLFWLLQAQWLARLNKGSHRPLSLVGLFGSFALIVYTLFLGHAGDEYRLFRRFGVVVFMGCTFIAQVQSAKAMSQHPNLSVAGRHLLISCCCILSIAILSLVLDMLLGDQYDRLEDAFEWWLMIALIANQSYLAWVWQRSHLHVDLKYQRI